MKKTGCWIVMLTSLAAGAAAAQDYPVRPVRMIVPFAPGGPTDVISRIVAGKLCEAFDQQVVVDNRAGAGGNVGTGIAANATPDGYTLLVVSSSFVVNPGLYAKIPYDPYKSFAPVSNMATMPNVYVVHPSVAAKSMPELVKLIQSAPKKYSFATPGIGTTPDLSAALFRLATKLDVATIPYNGAGPAIVAVIANQVPLGCMAMPGVTPHVRGGRLRGLAVTSAVRSGTPPAIVQHLHAAIVRIMAQPEVRERVSSLGYDIIANSPRELAAQIRSEVTKWSKVVKDAGITVE